MNRTELYTILRDRFEAHPGRHEGMYFNSVFNELDDSQIRALIWMEETGGEPDVFELDGKPAFADFSKESPQRRSCCYDRKARTSRKKNPPETSAMELAACYGLILPDEKIYRSLQSLEKMDQKTSSWIETPEEIRDLGGALFGDRRYDHVFIYHNGADSYYGSRGFRAILPLDRNIKTDDQDKPAGEEQK